MALMPWLGETVDSMRLLFWWSRFISKNKKALVLRNTLGIIRIMHAFRIFLLFYSLLFCILKFALLYYKIWMQKDAHFRPWFQQEKTTYWMTRNRHVGGGNWTPNSLSVLDLVMSHPQLTRTFCPRDESLFWTEKRLAVIHSTQTSCLLNSTVTWKA